MLVLIVILPLLCEVLAVEYTYDPFHNQILQRIAEAEQNYADEPGLASKNYFDEQITKDLLPFRKTGIRKDIVTSAQKYGVKYQVIGHKLYRTEKCTFPARCEGVEFFLKQILADLNDTEFILNDHDPPKIFKGMEQVPVFSFSKSDHNFDILYPAWAFHKGGPALSMYPRGIGEWDHMRRHVFGIADRLSWKEKKDQAFFLGSRTSTFRDPLVLLSRRRPDLVDAKFTKNQAYKGPQDTLDMTPAEEQPFEYNCYYRYLFNYRGVAASFRFKHLFLCNSLVFHYGTNMDEFFYHKLIPYIHYVPIEDNTETGLEKLIEFFRYHEELAQRIAQRGHDWVRTKLTNRDVRNYWLNLLREYTKLIKYKVSRDESLVEV